MVKNAGGYGSLDGNIHGKDTRFSKTNQPKTQGRKPSIRKELIRLLESDGQLSLELNSIVSIGGIKVRKIKEIIAEYLELKPEEVAKYFKENPLVIKTTKAEAMAIRFAAATMNRNDKTAIDAISRFIDQVDGKPNQKIELPDFININYTNEDE